MNKNIKMISIIAFSVSIFSLFFACNKETDSENSVLRQKEMEGDPVEGLTILGDQLPNPYSIENMTTAYDSLVADSVFNIGDPSNILAPTHLYVRFLPEDSTEFNALIDDETLALFDYPLDYEIEQRGIYYHDPTIPEDECTWLYTVVPIDYSFPTNITYQILDSCIIPEENTPYYYYHDKMEEKSCWLFQSNLMEENEQKSISKKYPEGTISLTTTGDAPKLSYGNGVKCVKVITNNIVKIGTGYTNSYGEYYISKFYYVNKVNYSVSFENALFFKIWAQLNCFTPAYYNKGSHNSTGYSFNFDTNSLGWKWAAANNATFLYKMIICPYYNITQPPTYLRIWIYPMNNGWFGCAPMGRQINMSPQLFTNYLAIASFNPTNAVRWVLPDIFVMSQSTSTCNFYGSLWHELAHASHYSSVGASYWLNYISGIVSHTGYGDDSTGYNCGYIGVGEMWAKCFEDIVGQHYLNDNYDITQPYWFKPFILTELHFDLGFTPHQIYEALNSSSINRVSLIKEQLIADYPNQSSTIIQKFAYYGF